MWLNKTYNRFMTTRRFSTHNQNPEAVDALHDGVPSWMASSLFDWISGRLVNSMNVPRADLMRNLERLLRVNLTANYTNSRDMYNMLFSRMHADEQLTLDVVQGILALEGTVYSGTGILENILRQSGSKWKVVDDGGYNYRLEERVDSTVQAITDEVIADQSNASGFMAAAWSATFGRNPEPSTAYSKAIKAIEAASWQVVTPNDNTSTLGKIIGELNANPSQYKVSIREKNNNQGVATVTQDMQLIWNGQTDRHGTAHPVAPTQEAAEQAVVIAAMLCHQFIRGLISRV